jgi:2'-5' RNA ligase
MNLPPVEGTILWVLPDSGSGKHFSSLIGSLANRYNSFPFIPHITIAGVPDWESNEIKKAVNNISGNVEAFRLPVKKIQCGEHPYQKLTIAVEPNSGFKNILREIDHQFNGNFGKREFPHLSLLYSRLNCSGLQKEIENLPHKLPESIGVQTLALVKLDGTPDQWEIIHSRSLKEVSQV